MNISYSEPFSRGWNRMKKALFQPFDIAKWFTVGFTAFLATLMDSPGPGGGGNYSDRNYGNRFDWDEFARFPGYSLAMADGTYVVVFIDFSRDIFSFCHHHHIYLVKFPREIYVFT